MKSSIARQIRYPVPRLAGMGRVILAHLRLYRSRLQERAFLAQMSERDLHDIGLNRADQIMLVEKPFWRE